MEKPLIVGLAGFGVVGGGLCQLLRENADLVPKRAGRDISIKTILVRDIGKIRSVAPPEGAKITTNPGEIVKDPEIDVIVELMGGIEQARTLVISGLENGKDIVTANKALLAESGLELYKIARVEGKVLRYEASVAAAVPVVDLLRESLSGNRISSLVGILNGTSNYILSEMTNTGVEFSSALRKAQELGYAEADPTLDIDGIDAAHKLVVLTRLAFGMDFPFSELSIKGISNVTALDIKLAREFGYIIKLIGDVQTVKAEDNSQLLVAEVSPALVPDSFLLANVSGAFNALRVKGNASGPLFFHGRGAGALPTAGAVLADLIAIARKATPNNIGFAYTELPKANILPASRRRSGYYVRVMVNDTPGVLRDISGCMADEGISVAQMIQKVHESPSGVPLVFMTHITTEQAMQNALKRAANMINEPAVFFRVMERD